MLSSRPHNEHLNRASSSLFASMAPLLLLSCTAAVGTPASQSSEDMAASVTIIRDTFGVPHIYGPTDASVVFGAAYAQAEDNWWQVEDNFVRALGRGSELYGESAFVDDYLVRAMELERLSIEEYASAMAEMKAMYDAYAEGFNYYLRTHPEAETRLLDRVEPWYTLALIRFKYHHNEYLGYAGLETEHTERLLRSEGLALGTSAAESSLAFAREISPNGERALGSNEVALSGAHTASGFPMLLINPHVSFFGLSQYWEVHLVSEEGLEFAGQGRYGFMLPYMGNSRVLGWTYTDNYSDIGDLYVEHFDDQEHPLQYRYGDGAREAVEWSEEIGVRGADGSVEMHEVKLRKTHHGPIVGALDGEGGRLRPLAAKLARLQEGGWIAQWHAQMTAGSLQEWKAAASRVHVAYQNTMYADCDGNILYLYNAAVPRRDEAYDWLEPVDGSDPGTEWDGYHALEELPQFLNPGTGWLQNTNSDPLRATTGLGATRADFPSYMVGSEAHNARAVSATRIMEGLTAHGNVTLDDFARGVLDTRLSVADERLPGLFAEYGRLRSSDPSRVSTLEEAIAELDRWNREADTTSVATTLFVRWATASRGRPRSGPFAQMSALESVIDGLEQAFGTWRVAWGTVNRAQRPGASGHDPFDDALTSVAVPGAPGWLGSFFTYHTTPSPGGSVGYGVHGNSFVKVIEFGPEIRARSILTFGASGHPDSPHYFDQAPIYAAKRFKPAWFSRADVEANAEAAYRPGERR